VDTPPSGPPSLLATQSTLGLEARGTGDPLVLVHGLATTRLIWRRAAPALSAERRVVMLDVPGFGASPPAGEGFELAVVADAIAAGLDEAGVERPFDLVGHSMGGAIALTLADRHPDVVRKLVLVSPAGLRPMSARLATAFGVAAERLIPVRRAAAPAVDWRWARRLLLATGTVNGSAVPPTDARAMLEASRGATRTRAALATVASSDLRPLLASVPAPLGALWGEADRIIPPTGIGTVLAHRPDAQVATVPGAGHIAMMERPEAFSQALEDILAQRS
jgi:pimeloyl-ACP methyl ester carboxylesterase